MVHQHAGATVLGIASLAGNEPLVRAILDLGANPNVPSVSGIAAVELLQWGRVGGGGGVVTGAMGVCVVGVVVIVGVLDVQTPRPCVCVPHAAMCVPVTCPTLVPVTFKAVS